MEKLVEMEMEMPIGKPEGVGGALGLSTPTQPLQNFHGFSSIWKAQLPAFKAVSSTSKVKCVAVTRKYRKIVKTPRVIALKSVIEC